MPFFLRSDEELIAEATRALEELGVQIVVDDRSRSLEESWQPLQPVGKILHRMLEGDVAMHPLVAVHTVRDALEEWCHQGAYAELYTSLLVASVPNGEGGLSQHSYSLLRNRGGVVDVRASVRAWWREVQAQETSSGVFTCRQCQRRGDQAGGAALSCRACWAAFCVSCAQRMVQSNAPCPACASCCTRIDESPPIWGVPWDMPRPTPSPPQAAPPAPSSSALPRRMAAAVGPDGWLRPPPQHQRMHPVDVLVDGVLAALDGYVMVNPMSGSVEDQRYIVRFERLPLREDFSPDHATLEQARQYLKRVLPSVARQAARCVRHEVDVRVRLSGERGRGSVAATALLAARPAGGAATQERVRFAPCARRWCAWWHARTPSRASPSMRSPTSSSASASARRAAAAAAAVAAVAAAWAGGAAAAAGAAAPPP